MAQLQDEIISIQEYFRSVEYYGKGLIVKVSFPPRWSVYPSDDGRIKVVADNSEPNLYFYYVDLSQGTLEEVFSLIRETISMNIETVKKVSLMKEKFEELKELFASHSLNELSTLKFVCESDSTKPKRKYNKKKKVVEEEPDPEKKMVEETVEEVVNEQPVNKEDNNDDNV